MITESIVKRVCEIAVSGAKGTIITRGVSELRERFDNDTRIQTALQQHREDILWTT
jgi:hypothetical protein